MLKKYKDKEKIYALQADFHNKQIADLLKNKNEFNAIKEEDGELIQVIDHIFKTPDSNNGRAHFYAPVKKLFGKEIDTVWFNIIFIWFTSLIVYLTLMFDVFRRLMNLFGGDRR